MRLAAEQCILPIVRVFMQTSSAPSSSEANNGFEKSAAEAAAFQRIWLETLSKTMQAAFTLSPDSSPPEILRQIRGGILQALAESWDRFMRSPQFLEGMKQWLESAISFRKLSNELLSKARNDLQAPSRTDIDTIMLAVRHMEKRLLDRIEDLSGQVLALKGSAGIKSGGKRVRAARARPRRSRRASRTAGKSGG
jgi:hypothetical protein